MVTQLQNYQIPSQYGQSHDTLEADVLQSNLLTLLQKNYMLQLWCAGTRTHFNASLQIDNNKL